MSYNLPIPQIQKDFMYIENNKVLPILQICNGNRKTKTPPLNLRNGVLVSAHGNPPSGYR